MAIRGFNEKCVRYSFSLQVAERTGRGDQEELEAYEETQRILNDGKEAAKASEAGHSKA